MFESRQRIIGLALLLVLPLAGCGGDDDITKPTEGSVEGTITDIDGGAPITDAAVVLVRPVTLEIAATPTSPDTSGFYSIEEVEPGEYAVFIYHGTHVVFDRTADLIQIEAGLATKHDLRLLNSGFWKPGGYQIAGTVIDAATGSPVPSVYVGPVLMGMNDLFWMFRGVTLPEWTTTDSGGQFSVDALAVTDHAGHRLGILGICATKKDYRPYTLVGQEPSPIGVGLLPFPTGEDSTLHVEIQLRRDTPAGQHGAVRGQVSFLGNPIANIQVAVSINHVSDPDTLPSITLAVPIPGKVAVTDSDGEFLIDALAPGDYSLAPAFLTSDGYVQDDLHWDNRFTLTESDTVQLGNVEVLKAISPENPPDGSEITDGAPEFRWEALPDSLGLTAASYELWWSTGYMMYGPISVEEPRWQWPEQSPLQPGSHIRWEIQVLAVGALSEEPMVVATFECHATFTVAP